MAPPPRQAIIADRRSRRCGRRALLQPRLRRTVTPLLIAGPTASGKSALALAAAERDRGMVINADALQVYAGLRILTARPSPEDEARAPHRLYGHVAPGERYSVGSWLADVAGALAEAEAAGLRPIIVGGTGLYFRALTQGLAPVPPVPPEIRERWKARAEGVATGDLHRLLAGRSASEAARLRPTDRARILRALEVLDATGRPLPEWQALAARPLIDPAAAERIVIAPDRAELHRRIAQRFQGMIDAGALNEARAIAALGLDPALPAMKALGLRPLLRHLAGALSLDEAIARGIAETRQYAKRQETWFRHQMADWPRRSA
ncbi:MAG: tRNA (adenosine(37)-N6)-dimethylallyltransferase MiaA [Bauldia sp.]|nr:tRNA (adenosine(37)-N6)-dimethylallyltransferase MiaA [Bauldia sp.]